MKKSLLLAYLALAITLLLPLAGGRDSGAAAPDSPPGIGITEEIPDPTMTPEPPAETEPLHLRVRMGAQVQELPLEEYLLGVVAAEMPASFPEEALKAQAVAARSYALYCAATGKHPDADVCTDPACCQAWSDETRLRETWGEDYTYYRERIARAVADTAGQALRYGGEPVFAAFHASSPGATEDSGAIWSALPYLTSVSSPETAETVPNLISAMDCSALDFRDVILSACPQADLTGAPETWLGELERDKSGRVTRIRVGGETISGTRIRSLFSLRSTAFSLEYREGRFCFTVRGNGHGVGMSQYGAKLMAEQGESYVRILAHYYPGTDLS